MGYIVTDLVKQQARKLFAPDTVDLITSELETMRLPLVNEGTAPERIHLAILYLSGGDMQKFDEACRLAKLDWRDLLVATGLANENWPDVLRGRGIDFRGA